MDTEEILINIETRCVTIVVDSVTETGSRVRQSLTG